MYVIDIQFINSFFIDLFFFNFYLFFFKFQL